MGIKTKSQNHGLFVCLCQKYTLLLLLLLLLLKPKMTNQIGVTINYS
jgi:hypothetical protein